MATTFSTARLATSGVNHRNAGIELSSLCRSTWGSESSGHEPRRPAHFVDPPPSGPLTSRPITYLAFHPSQLLSQWVDEEGIGPPGFHGSELGHGDCCLAYPMLQLGKG